MAALLVGGSVAALVASSNRGLAVRTVALDAQPGDVTYDPASGHAFIATYTLDPTTHQLVSDAHMDIVDVHTGALLGTMDIGSIDQSTDVDTRAGRVVVAEGGDILVIDTQRRRVLRTIALVPSPGAPSLGNIALNERRGRIYVPESAVGMPVAELDVLDVYSGALLRRTPIG